jgi:EAL domain-containing protein (putative c-di-GMP-specific phosphodiesterase class I)/GGDEF domain-containing protein/PAS domain-containing protein
VSAVIDPAAIELLRRQLDGIADQLCETVDQRFDFHIEVDSADPSVQKLGMLINFLLETVRRSVGGLEEAKGQLERRVEERTRELDLVVSGANDGVWLWQLGSGVLRLSKRWHELLGLAVVSEETGIETWFSRVHPEDLPTLRAALRSHLEGLSAHLSVEYRIRHAGGQWRRMLCRGLCSRDERGRPRVLAGSQTDITPLRCLDSDTGLPNELHFNESVRDRQLAGEQLTVMMLGIDRLGSAGDTLGRAQFTRLLGVIVERIASLLPLDACLARLTGDAFGVALDEAALPGPDGLHGLLTRLTEGFARPFATGTEGDLWLGLSCGVVRVEGTEPGTDLPSAAWLALRRARRAGLAHNFYSDGDRESSVAQARMEQLLRTGLQAGHVQAWLQPLFGLASRRTVGFEALARLVLPDGTLVSPAQFLPVAEHCGLMAALGECILHGALATMASWRSLQPEAHALYVSVNVAAEQLTDSGLARQVLSALEQHGLPASALRLEVTEGAFIENLDQALHILGELREQGVKIALDDFGTGYSSLAYLRRLPLDVVKLDRSFVTGIDTAEDRHAIVATVHNLARQLSLEVVAEGIETEGELRALQRIGIQTGQGWLHGRARAPAEALLEWQEEAMPLDQTLQRLRREA